MNRKRRFLSATLAFSLSYGCAHKLQQKVEFATAPTASIALEAPGSYANVDDMLNRTRLDVSQVTGLVWVDAIITRDLLPEMNLQAMFQEMGTPENPRLQHPRIVLFYLRISEIERRSGSVGYITSIGFYRSLVYPVMLAHQGICPVAFTLPESADDTEVGYIGAPSVAMECVVLPASADDMLPRSIMAQAQDLFSCVLRQDSESAAGEVCASEGAAIYNLRVGELTPRQWMKPRTW